MTLQISKIEIAEEMEISRAPLMPRVPVIKRCMDIVVAWPMLMAALPLLVVLGVMIKLISRGPVLFTQERIGLHGQIIRVWKIRTMYPDAAERLARHLKQNPEAAREWAKKRKLRNDPRVLPYIGKIIRRSSMDELPQLWNVLCGHMSMIGPRPLPAYHLEHFPRSFRTLRQSVLPGLTGLWQVKVRSDGGPNIMRYLDTYYIRHWSPLLDMGILLRTVPAVLGCRGAY